MSRPWVILAETTNADGLQGEPRRLIETILRGQGVDPRGVVWMGVTATTRITEARGFAGSILERLAELNPKKVLALGGTAATVALGASTKAAITKRHGLAEWMDLPGGGRALLVSCIAPHAVFAKGSGAAGNAMAPREWVRDIIRDVEKWCRQDEPIPMPELPLFDLWTKYPIPGIHRPATVAELARALEWLDDYEAITLDLETEPRADILADLQGREHTHGPKDRTCKACREWSAEYPLAGLDPAQAEIMAVGLGTVNGPQVVLRGPLLRDPKALALVSASVWETVGRRTVLHNAKFDVGFIGRKWGRWPVQPGGDTMLLSWLLDERPVRSQYRAHGLKDVSRYLYDMPDYAFDWPRFWSTPAAERDWAAHDRYLALDVHNTARLWWDYEARARDEAGLFEVHEDLLWPATVALARAEGLGIPVDREYLIDYRRRLDRRLDRRLRALRAAIGDPDFNPGSAKEVEAMVFDDDPGWGMEPVAFSGFKTTLGTKGEAWVKRNSRKEQLEKLAQEQADRRQARILRSIVAWRHDAKARETYAEGLLRASAGDGRVHSSFNLAGAVTGRLSSSDPNLQNIPKRGPTADAIRRAFATSDEWLLMEADYSQLELRVAALLSKDDRFAAVYREGRDIHREVASVMFSKPPEELDYMERYLAKAVDFGALYGRSGKAISMGAEMEYYEKHMGGTKWTAEEAQAFVDRFLGGFPNLRDWMRDISAQALADRELVTPFGRRRRFPLVLRDDRGAVRRQAFNTPIQSVASDICLSAFIRLGQVLDPKDARPMVTIHDAVLLEVNAARVHEVSAVVRRIMEDVPEQVRELNADLAIPFVVDVKVGRTWRDGDMHEPEEAAE